jgi:hypothetical protein
VVIAPIDQDDFRVALSERSRRRYAAKTAADDHNSWLPLDARGNDSGF